MEACEPITNIKMKPYVEEELKRALKRLHLLQIIHFDIKMENVCYSYARKCFIFIDFGLSKIVKETQGEKTRTFFRGSIQFCSSEMENQYLN